MENRKQHLLWLVVAAVCLLGACRAWNSDEVAQDVKNFASETYEGAKEKSESVAGWARDKYSQNFGSESGNLAQNVKVSVSEAMEQGKAKAEEEAKEIGDFVSGKGRVAMEYAKGKSSDAGKAVGESFEQAKQKVGEAYASAKDNIKNSDAKAKYEATKEKASDAAGDLGAKWRNSKDL